MNEGGRKEIDGPEAFILSCVGTGFTNTAKKTFVLSSFLQRKCSDVVSLGIVVNLENLHEFVESIRMEYYFDASSIVLRTRCACATGRRTV